MKKDNFWNPYFSGFLLGLLLLLTFYLFGRGLGASGFFDRLAAAILYPFSPHVISSHIYWHKYFYHGHFPLDNFLVYLAIGVLIGGFFAARLAGDFNVRVEKGPKISNKSRYIWAFIGGIILAIATRFSRGCTSGQALTGGAELLVGSWIFAFSFFFAGPITAFFIKKLWR